MSGSVVTQPVGPTYAISVANTQSTAIGVVPIQRDTMATAEFFNSGTTHVCVVLAPYASTPATPALAFPVAGTPTVPNSFMLPGGMTQPRIVTVPHNGFCVSAIASAAGPAIIYITPVSTVGG